MPNIKKKYPCQWFLKDKESKLFSIRSSFLLIGSQGLPVQPQPLFQRDGLIRVLYSDLVAAFQVTVY